MKPKKNVHALNKLTKKLSTTPTASGSWSVNGFAGI